jgi:hypothetical protein
MRVHAEPDFSAVAAIIPATLLGALTGSLLLGPEGFLLGGVLAGSAGAVAAKRVVARLVRLHRL